MRLVVVSDDRGYLMTFALAEGMHERLAEENIRAICWACLIKIEGELAFGDYLEENPDRHLEMEF